MNFELDSCMAPLKLCRAKGNPCSHAERHFVRGVKALQKLAVPDGRLLDFQEAKSRIEKLGAETRGQERLETMQRWLEVTKL